MKAMISNRRLLLPYAAPYLAFVFIATFFTDSISTELNYLFRIIFTTTLLVWGWKWYIPLNGPRSIAASIGYGILFGLVGVVVWLLLLAPFIQAEEITPWSLSSIILRLIAAGLIVPLFEEILIRGMIFGLIVQWWQAKKKKDSDALLTALDDRSINDLPHGSWSWPAIIISTLAFAAGHQIYEWPAAIAYGLLMCGLLIFRKDILSCIVAHSVTNITLAGYVIYSGNYHFW